MARQLNRTRMRDTRILVIFALIVGVSCSTMFPDESFINDFMDLSGFLLVMLCALGRIYCTTFIGGHKNSELITYGPYSLCRNPLYFCSILGAAGIGLMTNSLLTVAITTTGFIVSYSGLIKREEQYLLKTFGERFKEYRARVPKLVPSLRYAEYPPEAVFRSRNLNRAVLDALWWFAPYPLFELAEHLREAGLIKPIFMLP